MKKSTAISIVVAALLVVSAVAAAAQQAAYRLIDIPTLGGPGAAGQVDGPGASQFLNSAGVVVGASTASCGSGCFVTHGFRWQGGVLTDLGALGSLPGQSGSHATSVNARGWATGGSSTTSDPSAAHEHAVLWMDSGITDLGTLGSGTDSAGLYVKNAGDVAGFSTVDTTTDPFAFVGFGPYSSPTHAFVWKNGVMQDVGTLGGPDSFLSAGCNDQRSGVVVGSSFVNSTPNAATGVPTLQAYVWDNGTMTPVPTLGGHFAAAQCANNLGQVIGQSGLPGDAGCDPTDPFGTCAEHAFLWDGSVLTDLKPFKGGSFSIAIWLNDAGEAVGGADTENGASFHAVSWQNGQIQDLGTLDGDCFSVANAVNSTGEIIGQSFSCDGSSSRAVAWRNGTIIDLNAAIAGTSTLQLASTYNINDQGEIVGRGLPAGCGDLDACGHVFLLNPCDATADASCRARGTTGPIPKAATPTPGQVRAFVAAFRARLSRQPLAPTR